MTDDELKRYGAILSGKPATPKELITIIDEDRYTNPTQLKSLAVTAGFTKEEIKASELMCKSVKMGIKALCLSKSESSEAE